MAAALTSLTITMVALLGGIGVLPSSAGPGQKAAMVLESADHTSQGAPPDSPPVTPETTVPEATAPEATAPTTVTVEPVESPSYPLPAESGEGKRVVFSEGQQRVWLVREDGKVQRTYLVSGSLTDNLDPGTYAVYSRSKQAWGIDDSGTMKWFVRFTTGDTGAAIGFHDIPVADGQPAQLWSQLGTRQSHGCIRQKESDAKALWTFAPLDTTVVVTT
jgi:lipoprotein-anchoring transpeptidase ErfK/SrfK